MAKKTAKPVPKKKSGERTATAHEESQLEKREKAKGLAADYLVRRDGMDLETAMLVVDGLEPADIEALIVESNDASIAKAKEQGIIPGAQLVSIEAPHVDYHTIPALFTDGEFALSVIACITANETKKQAEAQYKGMKKVIIDKCKAAGVARVEVETVKLTVYPGVHRQLSELKLIEQGVDPQIIAKCWDESPYEDVRITVPKVGEA